MVANLWETMSEIIEFLIKLYEGFLNFFSFSFTLPFINSGNPITIFDLVTTFLAIAIVAMLLDKLPIV